MTSGAEEEMFRARSPLGGPAIDPPDPAALPALPPDPDLDVGIVLPSRIPAREVLRNRWVWLSLAALFGVTAVTGVLSAPRPGGAWMAAGVADAVGWTAIFSAAVALSWLLPLDEGRWRRSVPALVAAGTAIIVARIWAVNTLAGVPLEAGDLVLLYPMHLLFFLSNAGAGYAIFFHYRRRDSEEVESRLQAALARANLQLLEMQVDPHFLFNTLNSVAALIGRDPDGAVELLRALKRLLARAECTAQRQTVALADEVELVRVYLAIEQRRLGARLRVEWRVDPRAEEAEVPRLVLQTLVENAVRHGVAALRRGGTVEIGARRAGERLHAWVEDDGAGMHAATPSRRGIGIAGTRERLRHLYGAGHVFEVGDRPGGGVRAWIDLPFTLPDGAAEVRP
jgi:hypothetical protein